MKNNLVNVFKIIAISFFVLTAASNVIYANGQAYPEDEFTGPGIGIVQNEIAGYVYNDGGPGFTIKGFSITEDRSYVEEGPVAVDIICSPDDYLKILVMKPGDFTFIGSSKEDKLGLRKYY